MNKTYLCIDYVLNKSRNPTLMNDGPWCMAEYDIAGEMVLFVLETAFRTAKV